MSQSVCLYSELEPYSGSIRHDPSDLPRLIGDLKFACLFYDVVVLHHRNLWEHPLTLPALEILGPFVQNIQLWTGGNKSGDKPADYVDLKVQEKFEAFLGKGYLKKRKAVNEIIDRCQRLTWSYDWNIPPRNGAEQAAYVLTNIVPYLSRFKDKRFRHLYPLLDFVERMQANNAFKKEEIFARVGNLRGIVHFEVLSDIVRLIETEFLRAGVAFNEQADIYLRQSAQHLRNAHFGSLPFAQSKLERVKTRMNSVGFNLDDLINLPVSTLFEIAQSEQWRTIRNALLNESFDADVQEEMRSVFSTHLSFPNKVEKLLNISCHFQEVDNSRPDLSPLFMPSPWGLVSQSLLGSARVAASLNLNKASKTFILDLGSRVLYDENLPNSKVELTEGQTNLLSILVDAGESGLTVEHIKQLCLELDLITWKTLKWESQAKLELERGESFFLLRDKVYHLKQSLKNKLKPLGLRIAGEKGKWYLENDSSDQDFLVNLSSTGLEECFEQKERQEPPKALSKQSQTIWDCLSKESPNYVHAKRLAEVFEEEGFGNTQKQISDAINKLKQRLKNEPWMIKASSMGEYALVRR